MVDATIPEPFVPRSVEQIVSDLEQNMFGTITSGFEAFFTRSVDRIYIQSYAEIIRENEVMDLAMLLAGWVEYCDGVDEEKMSRLGLSDAPVTPQELNRYLFSHNLDAIGSKVGVVREEGTAATGEVTFTVADSEARIYEGTRITTNPITSDITLGYLVDLDEDGEINESNYTTPVTGDTVTVPVVAEDVGSEYDLGPSQVTNMIRPPKEANSVINRDDIDGGEPVESDDSFRERIKNSMDRETFGGTTDGLKDGIRNDVSENIKIEIDEHYDQSPTYTNVIVSGGEREEILRAIENNRPLGNEHRLIRPETIAISVDCEIVSSTLSENTVRTEIRRLLNGKDIGEDFYEDELVTTIQNLDDDVRNIETLNVNIEQVESERHTYDPNTGIYPMNIDAPTVPTHRYRFQGVGNRYSLPTTPIKPDSVSITSANYDDNTEYTEGTDYRLIDNNRDDEPDEIVWMDDGNSPEVGDIFTVQYELIWRIGKGLPVEDSITYSSEQSTYNLRFDARDGSLYRIVDGNGETYERGTDWSVIDRSGNGMPDTIQWEDSNPDDGTPFYPGYNTSSKTFGVNQVRATVDGKQGTLLEEDLSWTTSNGSDNYFDTELHWRNASESGADSPPEGWKNGTARYPDDGTTFTVDYYLNQPLFEDLITTNTQKITASERISVTINNRT